MRFVSSARALTGFVVFAASLAAHASESTSSPIADVTPTSARPIVAVQIAAPSPSAELPEPKQWVLLLAGLGVVGWVAQRRR